ncbi:MAG TPA: hypothetical protein VNM24_03310 [Burkholderiales bacterium]|nr:hypothetical protein [Burkholderiales bacterium]
MIEQMIQRVFEGAGKQLAGQIDRQTSRRGIDRLVAGHRALPRSGDGPILRHAHDRSNISGDFLYSFVSPRRIALFYTADLNCHDALRSAAPLRKLYGRGRWRKRKGIARVRLADGAIHIAEVHWCEAAVIGKKKEFEIKRLL